MEKSDDSAVNELELKIATQTDPETREEKSSPSLDNSRFLFGMKTERKPTKTHNNGKIVEKTHLELSHIRY